MLIDVTRPLGRVMEGWLPTGVDRVSLEYVRHFGTQALALVRYGGRWCILTESDSRRIFSELIDPGPGFRWTIRRSVARAYVGLGGRVLPGQMLFNTGHFGLDSPDYAGDLRRRGLRPVFFLHDVIPITHPEYCRPGEAERHWQRIETMVTSGWLIIVNSSDTRAALEVCANARGWDLPRCVVAPLAAGSLPSAAERPPLAHPYFVVLGTIEPRKNHLLLLHVWRRLAANLGEKAPRLVIIGQRGWECEQVVDLLDRCEALRGIVSEESRCSDTALATLLRHARALLFPSFAEGFGIPLVEALALGLPVIASDLPIFHEIAGDIPEYLDPLDGPGWERTIMDYTQESSPSRIAQKERMAGYRALGWEHHFTVVDEALASLEMTDVHD
ncbi:MAG: glycosyltransferase family 4 protein [Proteobacteria bacterium]|nr:glycosyltransferase family 4 protein [Pseudomonadota bacterium]HQR04685.1 glycosyltransferase family 1 protein [Rhodocyclaceae bacterium]